MKVNKVLLCTALAFLLIGATFATQAQAVTFSDDFSGGINTAHWTVNPGAYTIDDSQGDIRISKPEGPGNWAQIWFNHDIYGDFDISVDYRDANLPCCQNQIQLNVMFGGQYVANRRENWYGNRYSVWLDPPQSTVGATDTEDISGTLRVARVGSAVTCYVNGNQIYQSDFNNSPVTGLWLSLQNNGTNDALSVTFDNFSITADGIKGICTPPPTGLVSWWKAENNANDSIGANHGTLVNGATFASGMVGQAFSFDGVDDYVSVAHSSSFDLTTAHTVDMWIKVNNLPNNWAILLNKWVGGQEDKALVIHSDGTIEYWLFGEDYDYAQVRTTSSLTPGVWYHIAATYDGTTAKIYVNGNLDNSSTASITVANSSGNLFFGYNPSRALYESWDMFSGFMDEIEWVNRSLTAQEIAAIYNAGSAGKCIQQYTLTVTKTGTGSVTSDPAGINCGNDCTETYSSGTTVTLTATPDSGSTFANWSGDCSGTNPTVQVTMISNKTCTAIFTQAVFSLNQDWNFVSFPKLPSNKDISSIMQGKNVRIIWGYDNENKKWLKWKPDGGDKNTLSLLEFGKGYWIYMDGEDSIDMTGWLSPEGESVTLYPGWNLIGWLGQDGISVDTALGSLGSNWKILWTWDNGQWSVKYTSPLQYPSIDKLYQRKAYWIKVDTETTW